jgi:predicted ribosomally synthesized peptide with nif11-like leader
MAGIKELQQKFESDKAFAESLQKASDIKELLQKIKDAGFDVKPEELAEAVGGKKSELADGELDAAAGGSGLADLAMGFTANPYMELINKFMNDKR